MLITQIKTWGSSTTAVLGTKLGCGRDLNLEMAGDMSGSLDETPRKVATATPVVAPSYDTSWPLV